MVNINMENNNKKNSDLSITIIVFFSIFIGIPLLFAIADKYNLLYLLGLIILILLVVWTLKNIE